MDSRPYRAFVAFFASALLVLAQERLGLERMLGADAACRDHAAKGIRGGNGTVLIGFL